MRLNLKLAIDDEAANDIDEAQPEEESEIEATIDPISDEVATVAEAIDDEAATDIDEAQPRVESEIEATIDPISDEAIDDEAANDIDEAQHREESEIESTRHVKGKKQRVAIKGPIVQKY